MIGLNQIAISILNNTCHAIRNITRIRQHYKTFSILHKAIELRGSSIVTDPKTFDIDIAKCLGLPHFKDVLLSIIDLS